MGKVSEDSRRLPRVGLIVATRLGGTWALGGPTCSFLISSHFGLPSTSPRRSPHSGYPTQEIKPSSVQKAPKWGWVMLRRETGRGRVWPGCRLPSQARSKGQAWAGVASGLSWFLSDLGQGVGWHQASLLATADADEAVSIPASAHAYTDLRREVRPGMSVAGGSGGHAPGEGGDRVSGVDGADASRS